MEKDEILRAYREGLKVHIPESSVVSQMPVPFDWAMILIDPCTITKVPFDADGNFCMIEVSNGQGRAAVTENDFPSLAFCKPQNVKSSLYCSCDEPNKMHNIGIGTLDFWVCKKCKKEIK